MPTVLASRSYISLRGRIGRGAEKSYCILVAPKSITGDARDRIETMVATSNGFEIAERDLKQRGPGEFFGTRQHGDAAFSVAQPLRDHELLGTRATRGVRDCRRSRSGERNRCQGRIRKPGVAKAVSAGGCRLGSMLKLV